MKDIGKKVIYQIYPRSFRDSNGDGIGDLRGIISKLDYLEELGIDMIWLNPFYPSPQRDNGYDISDYRAIAPIFGTMDDFEELVREAKKRGIGLMLDMVLNHSSTEHQWFQKALTGDKKYQDYYFIRPAQPDGSLPTNWCSKFRGPAWEPFGTTHQYYLHLYDKTQADLNWRNPEVRAELYDIVNFWIAKGVEGFRFDVINVIGKDEVLRDTKEDNDGKFMYTDKPVVHEYLQELNQETFGSRSDIVTVGEMSSTTIKNCIDYTRKERKELSMVFNFHHLKVDYDGENKWVLAEFDFIKLKRVFNEWGTAMSEAKGWSALFWNNHDQPRALSRFLNDKKYRVEGAKLLAGIIHLNRGTPYIYQGEEIGMTNGDYQHISDYQDVETLNAYQELLDRGVSERAALSIIQEKSRDNSRTPMQWSAAPNGGFSEGKPWLKINDNYKQINVEQEQREGSILTFYRQLIRLRKQYMVIQSGDYQPYLPNHPKVYGYQRNQGSQKLLVVGNFFETEVEIAIPEQFLSGEILISNYEMKKVVDKIQLKPYQIMAIYVS